jgi:hypothetical protein
MPTPNSPHPTHSTPTSNMELDLEAEDKLFGLVTQQAEAEGCTLSQLIQKAVKEFVDAEVE